MHPKNLIVVGTAGRWVSIVNTNLSATVGPSKNIGDFLRCLPYLLHVLNQQYKCYSISTNLIRQHQCMETFFFPTKYW